MKSLVSVLPHLQWAAVVTTRPAHQLIYIVYMLSDYSELKIIIGSSSSLMANQASR